MKKTLKPTKIREAFYWNKTRTSKGWVNSAKLRLNLVNCIGWNAELLWVCLPLSRLPLTLSSIEVLLHWGILPLGSFSSEVIFHWGRLLLRCLLLGSSYISTKFWKLFCDLWETIKTMFCWFQAIYIYFYCGCLTLRSSSIFSKFWKLFCELWE